MKPNTFKIDGKIINHLELRQIQISILKNHRSAPVHGVDLLDNKKFTIDDEARITPKTKGLMIEGKLRNEVFILRKKRRDVLKHLQRYTRGI